jgi:hypothetical protein
LHPGDPEGRAQPEIAAVLDRDFGLAQIDIDRITGGKKVQARYQPAGQIIEIAVQVLIIGAAPLAWVFLIATRRWNPEPSWIDRSGRIFASLWMVVVPAHLFMIRFPY